ncbi:hypothetical protein QBC46DRAFT_270088 [Diplogelasinospora grovesii]|uniref:Uncharacterized protein n=1 Tax=Diplogelasinospora grovesii TaxID=303347 RepID=A0AAN6S025_9PEZI|nr:hypothetical protein QBC46DRAFT_270088 [Diplogelasinospora grovesii]
MVIALTALANPVDINRRQLSGCAAIVCPTDKKCQVASGNVLCVPTKGQICGSTVCAAGLSCCNASCGICTKPGMMCTQQACVQPIGETCGSTTCPAYQECCNSSGGICTPPGGMCTQQFCGT